MPKQGRQDRKKPPTALQISVAARLRALMQEMGLPAGKMGKLAGVGRTTYQNWLVLENYPSEEAMICLCQNAHVTMDWLYRGKTDGLSVRMSIRLTARLLGMDPDEATAGVLERTPAHEDYVAVVGASASGAASERQTPASEQA